MTSKSCQSAVPVLITLLLLLINSDLNRSTAVVNALTIAVTGATGRVGRLVVENCLESGHSVTAIVRNEQKAIDMFSDNKMVTVRQLDFADLAKQSSSSSTTEQLVEDAFDGVDQVIWCASGFVDVPVDNDDDDNAEGDNDKKNTMKKESLDVIGMTYLLPTLSNPSILGVDSSSSSDPSTTTTTTTTNPSFIMLSSAGVTRPSWDDAKKEKYVGCADIPIIRMNPGGILDKKVAAEDMLRQQNSSSSGVVPYCIVRPTGLKFDNAEWPRGRTIFSQGDVAVGRMNANDLAYVLVDLLNQPSATGKTFECVTLAGYPPPKSLSPVLDRLELDNANDDDDEDDDAVYKAYQLMQQLLPGEEQDATRLEMGRTYEQVDSGEVQGRARGAGPTEREIAIANGVVYDDGQGEKTKSSFRSRIKKIFGRSPATLK